MKGGLRLRRHALPLGLSAFAVGIWVAMMLAVRGGASLGDLQVYEHASRLMGLGKVPYRDFALEYPPPAAGLFRLTELLPGTYAFTFSLLMLGCLVATLLGGLATARALGLGERRQAVLGIVVALTPFLLGELVETRFDLVLSALLAWTLWAAVTRRWHLAWVLLGCAVAVKLVPIVLVPLLVMAHRADRRARWAPALGAGALAAMYLPFLAIAPSGFAASFAYHLDRPLQVESVPASILLAGHGIEGTLPEIVQSYGSFNVVDGAGRGLSLAFTAALVAAVAALALRQRGSARGLVQSCAAALVAALVFGKVLSPQYLAWLLPLALLAPGRRGAAAAGLLVPATVLTQLVFPVTYSDLLRFAPLPVTLLIVRNVLLAVILALLWPRRRDVHSAVP